MKNQINENLELIKTYTDDIKNAIEEKGINIDDLEDCGRAIRSLGSGSGDVKLFETIEDMNNDENSKEGDLAIIYRNEIQNATVNSKFSKATFPMTVVLPEAVTDYIDIMYRAVDSSVMFECWGSLEPEYLRLDCYTEEGQIRIRYSSSDGITYTRDDGSEEELVDFGTEICFVSEYAEFNDAIGYFIQTGGNTFEGLYKYTEYKDPNYMYMYKDITYYYDDSKFLQVNYGEQSVFPIGQYYNMINTIRKTIGLGAYIDATCVYDGNDTLTLYYYKYSDTSTYSDKLWYCKDNTDTIYIGRNTSSNYAKKLVITLSTGEYVETNLDLVTTIVNSSLYVYDTINSNNYIFALCIGSAGIDWSYDIIFAGYNYNNTELTSTYLHTLAEDKINYCPAPTQLTLNNANQLLPNITGYGKNGIITGDGSIYNNLNNIDIWTRILNLMPSEETSENSEYKIYGQCRKYLSNVIEDKSITYLKEDSEGDIFIAKEKDYVLNPKGNIYKSPINNRYFYLVGTTGVYGYIYDENKQQIKELSDSSGLKVRFICGYGNNVYLCKHATSSSNNNYITIFCVNLETLETTTIWTSANKGYMYSPMTVLVNNMLVFHTSSTSYIEVVWVKIKNNVLTKVFSKTTGANNLTNNTYKVIDMGDYLWYVSSSQFIYYTFNSSGYLLTNPGSTKLTINGKSPSGNGYSMGYCFNNSNGKYNIYCSNLLAFDASLNININNRTVDVVSNKVIYMPDSISFNTMDYVRTDYLQYTILDNGVLKGNSNNVSTSHYEEFEGKLYRISDSTDYDVACINTCSNSSYNNIHVISIKDYSDTILPEEYNTALDTALDIQGNN